MLHIHFECVMSIIADLNCGSVGAASASLLTAEFWNFSTSNSIGSVNQSDCFMQIPQLSSWLQTCFIGWRCYDKSRQPQLQTRPMSSVTVEAPCESGMKLKHFDRPLVDGCSMDDKPSLAVFECQHLVSYLYVRPKSTLNTYKFVNVPDWKCLHVATLKSSSLVISYLQICITWMLMTNLGDQSMTSLY